MRVNHFIFFTVRAERKVRLCMKLFDFFRGRILIRLTWNSSRSIPNSVQILTWNFRKTQFRENFSKILCKPKLSSTKTCEISPYFLQFLFLVRIALTKFTQVLPFVVCIQVRKHVHKRITKRRYGEENQWCFVFGKPFLFTLGLGLTAPYSLGVLARNFYQTFVTVSTDFWLRFEPQIRPTRLAINFFINHCQSWKEGSYVCETVWIFLWVNTHPIDLKFVAFWTKFSGDSYVEFQEKTISVEFFKNSRANQGYHLPKLVKFRPSFCNFYFASVLRWENSHQYFHILFAPR